MIYAITFIFIVLDFVTGLIKALAKQEYSSGVMREGLFHKCGSILCVSLGALCEYAMKYIDLGIELPIAVAICGYIILMEVGSIIENIGIINPNIVPSELKKFFIKLD